MSLLQRLLSALVQQKVQAASELPSTTATEMLTTSLRVPSDLRLRYDTLAQDLGISLQQTLTLALRALMERGFQHPETFLMATRIIRGLYLHNIHAVDASSIHKDLTAEALHDENALLRIVNRDVVRAIAQILQVDWQWLAGFAHSNPTFGSWYNDPISPVKWAAERAQRNIVAYVVRVEGAQWDRIAPDDDYNNPQPQNKMALILHSHEGGQELSYPVYRMWDFERISDDRLRTVARIVLSRLKALNIPLRGITISEGMYQEFESSSLFPVEIVDYARNLRSWSVNPMLYGQTGPYQAEDIWLANEPWAGGGEFAPVDTSQS